MGGVFGGEEEGRDDGGMGSRCHLPPKTWFKTPRNNPHYLFPRGVTIRHECVMTSASFFVNAAASFLIAFFPLLPSVIHSGTAA